MDTAGKDGVIRHVMSGVNPQGCRVSSFQHPSAQALRHDCGQRLRRHLADGAPRGLSPVEADHWHVGGNDQQVGLQFAREQAGVQILVDHGGHAVQPR